MMIMAFSDILIKGFDKKRKKKNRFHSEKTCLFLHVFRKRPTGAFLHGYFVMNYAMQQTARWKNKNKRFKKRLQDDDSARFFVPEK